MSVLDKAMVLLLTGVLLVPSVASAELTGADIATLRERGQREGWTFTVGPNPATKYALDELCGRLPNPKRRTDDRLTPRKAALPASFDWRAEDGCTSVKNQGGCGSCWAFATVGAIECAIKIMDGVEVDLSEQWLVSCNEVGWGCGGGSWAFDLFGIEVDSCGETGGVLETDFPYQGLELPCNCSYPRYYTIDAWGQVDGGKTVPDVALMKQAIYDYGPIAVGVNATNAFQSYTGGVFNACETADFTNHGVVLVGWDDTMGTTGAWILRNSWGPGWGIDGYMYIEYDCSMVGDEAAYVVYGGADDLQVTPTSSLISTGPEGGPFTPVNETYTVTNTTASPVTCSVSTATPWLDLTGLAVKALGPVTLDPAGTSDVTVAINANALSRGIHSGTVTFTNETSSATTDRMVQLVVGDFDYFTELFSNGDHDLDFTTLTLTPGDTDNFYRACIVSATSFPTDPSTGTVLPLPDDHYFERTLTDGKQVSLYGVAYPSVFVASNGYLTFTAWDDWRVPSVNGHFTLPRVSGFFQDLNPEESGSVWWQQLADRAVVTYENVPQWTLYGGGDTANCQIELFFNGAIRITWLAVGITDGLVGVSAGLGRPPGFEETDLSTCWNCDGTDLFLQQPVGGWFEEGQSHALSVEVVGAVAYQWYRNGSEVPGAVGPELVFDPLTQGDTGRYWCLVTVADKATYPYESARVYILVAPPAGLPTAGMLGLALLACVCALAGALVILRRRR